jgi:hypothetical protein
MWDIRRLQDAGWFGVQTEIDLAGVVSCPCVWQLNTHLRQPWLSALRRILRQTPTIEAARPDGRK